MSTTSFINTDPTYDLAATTTSESSESSETTEASKSRESDDLFAASGSGRDIIVSRDDKDKE